MAKSNLQNSVPSSILIFSLKKEMLFWKEKNVSAFLPLAIGIRW